MKYGALFDLDGVLIDSESMYTVFWQEIDRLYPTGIPNYAIAIKGTTLPEILKNYTDPAVVGDIVRRINEFQLTMRYPIFPGVEDFLTDLRRHGIPAAIVTSSDDRKMAHLYEQHPHFRDYFDVIIDASKVTRSKPDPQGYLMAAQALGCKPEDCIVFEDSLQGLKAGKAAGAKVVALATTYPREQLQGFADTIIDGFNEVTVDSLFDF